MKLNDLLNSIEIPDDFKNKIYSFFKDQEENYIKLILQEKLLGFSEFLSGATHELNQPLNVMKIISQSILRDIDRNNFDINSAKEDIPEFLDQIDRLAAIIHYMRAYTKVPDFNEKKSIQLNDVITNLLHFIDQRMKNHGINFSKEFDENLPKISGNFMLLEQVISNLLRNARIAVEESENLDKKITIKTKTLDDDKVLIEIFDNGVGIIENLKDKVFDPFVFAWKEEQTNGLGLTLTKKIIEEHNGKISFTSEEGKETVFKVELPVGEESS